MQMLLGCHHPIMAILLIMTVDFFHEVNKIQISFIVMLRWLFGKLNEEASFKLDSKISSGTPSKKIDWYKYLLSINKV